MSHKQRIIRFVPDSWCESLSRDHNLDLATVIATRDALHDHFVTELSSNNKLVFRGLFTISLKRQKRNINDFSTKSGTAVFDTLRGLIKLSKPFKQFLSSKEVSDV